MILIMVIWCDKTIIWGQLAGKKPFSSVTKLIVTGFVTNKGGDVHARSQDPSWAISHCSPSQPAEELRKFNTFKLVDKQTRVSEID